MQCDEDRNERGDCRKCSSTGRNCQWYEAKHGSPASSSTSSGSREQRVILPKEREACSQSPGLAVLQPPSLAVGLNPEERRAVGFFLCRSARDLGYTFFTKKWINLSIQIGHQEPALRYAIAAIGLMHQSRQPFTHTSMHPVIKNDGHQLALLSYSKAMGHLRDYIDRTAVLDRARSIDVSLLACILFFVFEQLQNELASACLHMSTGLRLIEELRSPSGGLARDGSLSSDVYEIFDGFNDNSFTILRQHQMARQRRNQVIGLAIPTIPDIFDTLVDISDCLDALEAMRIRVVSELIKLAGDALAISISTSLDPAIMHCAAHTLSRSVDLSSHKILSRELSDLGEAYERWHETFQRSISGIPDSCVQAAAVLEVQYLAGMLNLRVSRSPSEMIWDELEPQLRHMLHLAEVCLLKEPLSTTACNIRYTNGELSGVGHGLALGTELLSLIYMAGMKSRNLDTRTRAIQLLQFANNKTTPYHADIWPRFMMRAAKEEERLAKELGKDILAESSETIPENARLSDIVFAQVPYRPRGVNMICTRYAFKDGAPIAVAVWQSIYDIFSDEQISEMTYTIPLPQACRHSALETSAIVGSQCDLTIRQAPVSSTTLSQCSSPPSAGGSWPNGLAFGWKGPNAQAHSKPWISSRQQPRHRQSCR
ncbi:Aspercryptin biosynthesis cluster-specific transcription regulator atnN [Pseudocercospora fuligena]|uniref:Aspercryptin biosynthesis cluster-specific transcription regulator atnN n=1 Tax=Pseudocercospora fuligena TaxID=685502 RepID=A0A8H6R9L8_9PEZI|nr:Aspercryptin biosynthesis cluster-specific transcription regulator atnN [Pseudocercospora fuligena]